MNECYNWFQLRADDTGVYVGHSAGVSKYTLVDGGLIWDTVLPKKPTAGEMVCPFNY